MAKQYLKIEQVVELTGLSQQTIYRRSRLKTFPSPEKVKGQKGGKQWVKTDVTKWVKANAKPDKVKYIDDDELMPEAEGMWKND
jgi:predicted DNA-binding transcriptional regulator AlpA